MRSIGLPVTVETIPYWGDSNNGHSFNGLLLSDGSLKGFNNEEDLIYGLNLSGKVTKIFRLEFEVQKDTPLFAYKEKEFLPTWMSDFNFSDVTTDYNVPVSDLKVVCNKSTENKVIYLGVFSPVGWQPVAWAEIKKGKALFKNMGTGYLNNEDVGQAGENIGNGIIYLPMTYKQNILVAEDYPVILTCEGQRKLQPDMELTETILIERKFPKRRRIQEFAEKMIDGYIEASNFADFQQVDTLHYITDRPQSHWTDIRLKTPCKYRYVRFKRNTGGLSIGEIKFLDENNVKLEGNLISHPALESDNELMNINDGNVLSYLDTGNIKELWVGFDFGKPVTLSSVSYCPRTDDNDITPGDLYELFYWENEWVSLGQKIADDYSLEYENAPTNALLWLRNHTKGKEERPFTYENGIQVWW